MRTSKLLTLAALTVWTALAPAYGETVSWNRQALGQTFNCPVSGQYG